MKKTHKVHTVLRLTFLIIGLQLLSVAVSINFGRTVNAQRILFICLFILVWVFMIVLLRKYPKLIATKTFIAVTVLVYAMVYGSLFMNMKKSDLSAQPIQGNNQATMTYTKDFFAKGYPTLEDVLKKVKVPSDSYKEIYRFENKDSACVIFYAPAPKSVKKDSYQAKDKFYLCPKLESIEMYKKNGKYYYIGRRNLMCAFSKNRSDEKTLRSDLQESLKKKEAFPEFKSVYTWGCSAYPNMENVSVAGKKCRKVIPLTMNDGSRLYFWLIDDISVKTKPASVAIQGMN